MASECRWLLPWVFLINAEGHGGPVMVVVLECGGRKGQSRAPGEVGGGPESY